MSEQPSSTIEKRALNIKEASAAYGISRGMIYKLIASGGLKSIKIGKRRLIPCDAMEALLKHGAQ